MTISSLFYTLLVWHFAGFSFGLNSHSHKIYTAMWAVQLHNSAKDVDAEFIASTLGMRYQKVGLYVTSISLTRQTHHLLSRLIDYILFPMTSRLELIKYLTRLFNLNINRVSSREKFAPAPGN
jgi:hypothetical protein